MRFSTVAMPRFRTASTAAPSPTTRGRLPIPVELRNEPKPSLALNRLDQGARIFADVQKTSSFSAHQQFVAGGCIRVAAQFLYIDINTPNRLRAVNDTQYPARFCQSRDLSNRHSKEPGDGDHLAYADNLCPVGNRFFEPADDRPGVEIPRCYRNYVDVDAAASLQSLQQTLRLRARHRWSGHGRRDPD